MATQSETTRYISAGLAAIGVIALAAVGYLKITTPEALQCQVDLADRTARLELTTKAMLACEQVLDTCTGEAP